MFEDVDFPAAIAIGAESMIEDRVHIVQLVGGRTEQNLQWAHQKMRFNVSTGIRSADHVSALLAFFRALRSTFVSFRFCDFCDNKSCLPSQTITDADQILGTGDGASVQFQLVKTYTVGSQSYVRRIQKPVVSSVVVALNGIGQTSGWSLDDVGRVTFDVAPAAGVVISAGFKFDVPVRFQDETLATVANFNHLRSVGSIILIEEPQ